MNKHLKNDTETLGNLLWMVSNEASEFLNNINQQPVARTPITIEKEALPEEGVGALKALEDFNAKYREFMTASTGPRYFGFVTGGSTPASIVGDWLVSTYDQNADCSIKEKVY